MDEVATTTDDQITPVFLSDLPLAGEAEEDARFGHGGVAETLRTIVRQCPTPYTIALYGTWGTGKSSVVGLLRRLLVTKADDAIPTIPTVVVDVWKYQDDSLRRVVLREMDIQGRDEYAQYNKKFKLDERIELESSLSTEFKTGVVYSDLAKRLKGSTPAKVLLGLCVLVALAVVVAWARYPAQVSPFIASVVGGVGAATAMLGGAALLLTPKSRTLSQGRFSDPFEFQSEFSTVLAQGYTDAERVLVVFDNLDRVTPDKAVEVLSTIKTFLEAAPKGEKSKAVFLVPCDDDAIRRQVEDRYKDEHNEDADAEKADEFLRKFFNVSLRLPEFLPTELEDYTASLTATTRVAALDDPRIAWMVAKAFRNNPRQVKQFVNVMVAEYLLVDTRSRNGELPEGFAADSARELTLFLLLRARFPREVDELREKGVTALTPEALTPYPDLAAFVQQVGHEAQIDNLSDWFTLRRSRHEMALAGVDKFLVALQDADSDAASGFIAALEYDAATQHNLSLAVQQRLLDIRNTTAFVTAFDTLLKALAEHGRRLDPTTMGDLLRRTLELIGKEPALTVTRVHPDRLAEVALVGLPSRRGDLAAIWAGQVSEYAKNPESKRDARFMGGLMSVLANHPDWFSAQRNQLVADLPEVVGKDESMVAALAHGEGATTWATPDLAVRLAQSMGEV